MSSDPRPQHRSRKKRRPRRIRRFDLSKALFALPNLFTLSSVFCGFYAMTLVVGNWEGGDLYRAAVAVFFGIFFDMADGRVARLTRTQSEFGVQLDSLADALTFGATPALIIYQWGLRDLGIAGALVCFAYAACGIMRLARFNVLAARGIDSSNYFVGVPIPLAAGVLMSLVMLHQSTFGHELVHPAAVVILMGVLSYLMVSNVRYRSFKKLRLSGKSLTGLLALTILFVFVAARLQPTFALFVLLCGYVVFGLLEEVIFFRRRRRQKPSNTRKHSNNESSHPSARDAPTSV